MTMTMTELAAEAARAASEPEQPKAHMATCPVCRTGVVVSGRGTFVGHSRHNGEPKGRAVPCPGGGMKLASEMEATDHPAIVPAANKNDPAKWRKPVTPPMQPPSVRFLIHLEISGRFYRAEALRDHASGLISAFELHAWPGQPHAEAGAVRVSGDGGHCSCLAYDAIKGKHRDGACDHIQALRATGLFKLNGQSHNYAEVG